jgi:hypothetical protein
MNVIGIGNQCPWGRDHIDLRGIPLTSEQKCWLGTQVSTNTLKVAQLVARYQLDKKVLYKYGAWVAKGAILYSGEGRPAKVTPEQKKSLVISLQSGPMKSRTEDFQKLVEEMAQDTAEARRSIYERDSSISDEAMDEEEVDIHTVNGLGIDIRPESKVYIVFAKSRATNVKFYEWFIKTILIGYVQRVRIHHPASQDKVAWFQLDGEPKQIEFFKNAAIMKLLTDHTIVVGKPPASTTATTQPCDAGNCFKGPKTVIKKVTDEKLVNVCPTITDDLKRIFKLHTAAPKVRGKQTKRGLSTEQAKYGRMGILRVQFALRQSMKPTTITKSFQICGIYPFNFKTMLAQCTAKITPEECATWTAKLPELTQEIMEKGEISDAKLDGMDIRRTTDKDKLVLYRRRSVILSNKEVAKSEYAKLLVKQVAANAGEAAKAKRKIASDQAKARKQARTVAPPAASNALPLLVLNVRNQTVGVADN